MLTRLAEACPENYRVWLGLARVRSRNFTAPDAETQTLLDRAADCAKTVDDYASLQAVTGGDPPLKPFSPPEAAVHEMPDVAAMERIKPIRVPLASEETIREAREASRLRFLKFLLGMVIIVGLVVAFVVSCSNGVNPIMNAIDPKWSEGNAPVREISWDGVVETEPAVTGENGETQAREVCPYAKPESDMSAGMEGDGVRWAQWYLIRCGAPIEETGTYDDITRQAVVAFQTANGLRVDGIVGPETSAKLQELLGG